MARTLEPLTVVGPQSDQAHERSSFALGEHVSARYEIREVLGEGGMSRVFEAHDHMLNRRVAIKASWPGLDPSFLQREAQALAAIGHPGVVSVYDFGSHRGIPYAVLERIHGISLARFLEQRTAEGGEVGIDEALEIFIAASDALAAAHGAGIIHGDIKPANMMLAPGGRVVLMDFGLVRPGGQAPEAIILGTPEYMAPEKIRNQVAPADAFLLDVYALGILFYEVLTGTVPFEGGTMHEVFAQHLTAKPPPLAKARRDVPPRLAALVEEMLAKDPLDRPTNMEAIAWRLRTKSKADTAAKRASYQVLIVDDDAEVAMLLEMLVERALDDVEVHKAPSADAAIAQLANLSPQLMLLDLNMPSMNGIEFCMYLRGTHALDGCTIILVSASATDADRDLLRKLGITRFVQKGGRLSERLTPFLHEARDDHARRLA